MLLRNKTVKPMLLWRVFYITLLLWTVAKTIHNCTELENTQYQPNQIAYCSEKVFGLNTNLRSHCSLPTNAAPTLWCIIKKQSQKPGLKCQSTDKHTLCLAIFTLLLSGDVELNPGPIGNSIYPCPFCEINVEYGMKALQCDNCEMWYHKTCVSICTENYENLENNSKTYLCCRCNHPNYISDISSRSIPTENSFEPLMNATNSDSLDGGITFAPKMHSSPKTNLNRQTHFNNRSPDSKDSQHETDKDTTFESTDCSNDSDTNGDLPPKGQLYRTAVINANSLEPKIADIEYLVDTTHADQFMITETKLNEEKFDSIKNKLISLGYTPYRDDCKGNEKGVMIMIKNEYKHTEVNLNDETNENIFQKNQGIVKWIEVTLVDNLKMFVGVFYREPGNEKKSIEQLWCLVKSLENIMKCKRDNDIIMIGGDFNCGDIDWDNNLIKTSSNQRNVDELLLQILDNHDLTQHQTEPTRLGRTLDLFCTNRPQIVKHMITIPGISDHDIPIIDCEIKPSYNKKEPRLVFDYKRADFEKMKELVVKFREKYFKVCKERNTRTNWKAFKTFIVKMMNKYIPMKKISVRKNLAWLNRTIKRMIKKKQRFYNRAKRTHKKKTLGQV